MLGHTPDDPRKRDPLHFPTAIATRRVDPRVWSLTSLPWPPILSVRQAFLFAQVRPTTAVLQPTYSLPHAAALSRPNRNEKPLVPGESCPQPTPRQFGPLPRLTHGVGLAEGFLRG